MDVSPYSTLPVVYDTVMAHVDYRAWADFIDRLIRRYQSGADSMLEFGCGTGSLATHLLAVRQVAYLGIDSSEGMIDAAVAKHEGNTDAAFEIADFTTFRSDRAFDLVLLVYDGLNYLVQDSEVRMLFRSAHEALRAGGVFILDQSTPSNSLNNASFFQDTGRQGAMSYVRESVYDEEARLHHTTFEITRGNDVFREHHIQRAYEVAEVERLVVEAAFQVEAAFDGITEQWATESSERVHWVLRKGD